MAFNQKKTNQNSNSKNVVYKNIGIRGAGFINQLRLIKKGDKSTLIAKLSLQQGKVIDGNFDDVENFFFESIVFDEDVKNVLIDGIFDGVSINENGVTIVKPEMTLSGAFSFSNITRVDIVDSKPCIHSPIIGCAYLAYDDDIVYDNRKSKTDK